MSCALISHHTWTSKFARTTVWMHWRSLTACMAHAVASTLLDFQQLNNVVSSCAHGFWAAARRALGRSVIKAWLARFLQEKNREF